MLHVRISASVGVDDDPRCAGIIRPCPPPWGRVRPMPAARRCLNHGQSPLDLSECALESGRCPTPRTTEADPEGTVSMQAFRLIGSGGRNRRFAQTVNTGRGTVTSHTSCDAGRGTVASHKPSIRGEEPSLRSSQIANPNQIKIGRPKGAANFYLVAGRGFEPLTFGL